MHFFNGSSEFQINCHWNVFLRVISEPMMDLFAKANISFGVSESIAPLGTISSKRESRCSTFCTIKRIWICGLQNASHFVSRHNPITICTTWTGISWWLHLAWLQIYTRLSTTTVRPLIRLGYYPLQIGTHVTHYEGVCHKFLFFLKISNWVLLYVVRVLGMLQLIPDHSTYCSHLTFAWLFFCVCFLIYIPDFVVIIYISTYAKFWDVAKSGACWYGCCSEKFVTWLNVLRS